MINAAKAPTVPSEQTMQSCALISHRSHTDRRWRTDRTQITSTDGTQIAHRLHIGSRRSHKDRKHVLRDHDCSFQITNHRVDNKMRIAAVRKGVIQKIAVWRSDVLRSAPQPSDRAMSALDSLGNFEIAAR